MAQENLANVWIHLQERIDVGHIIPEIIGHFALSSVGRPPNAARSFSFFVWIKVIFDLQRTYSQSSIPSLATQAYLIQPRILLTTIHHVLDTRLRLYPYQRQMDEKTLAQRYFVARVLHSGLRALQLRRKPNESLSVKENEDINAMQNLVQNWWVEAEGHLDEQFILRKCQTAISQISRGPKSSSLWHKPACGSCELRDNQNSLVCGESRICIFSLQLTKRQWHALTPRITNAFEEQLAQLRADDGPPFWALFDILWAAEVGYIQWFADRHSGMEVSGYASEVHTLKGKIRNAVPEPRALTVLFHGWSQDLETPDPLLPSIGHSLNCFYSFLRDRQANLVDSDLVITTLSGELQDEIESWIPEGSRYRELNLRGPDKPPLDTAYVLSCPQMHVVPEFELRTFVENRRPDLMHIFNNPTLLDIGMLQMQCPRCSPTFVVKHARMIEPLNHLCRKLWHLAEASRASRDALVPEALPLLPDLPVRNPPSHSSTESVHLTPSSSPHSPRPEPSRKFSTSSRSTTSDTVAGEKGKSNRLSKAFSFGMGIVRTSSETSRKPARASSVVEVKSKCSFDRYCFSADGRVLILWKSEDERIFASTIPTQDGPESDSMWSWNTFVVPRMILAAGGKQKIAGISKIGNQHRLLVFSAPDPVAILDKILPHGGQVRSIAVSPDSNYIAVGSDRQVFIYAVNDALAEPKSIMLSNQNSPVSSQKVNFSPEGNMLAIVTRRTNGQIEVILQDHLKGTEIWQRKSIEYGKILDNDHGLSAVFYNTKKHRVVLFAYINKPYSIVHSKSNQYVHWKTQNGKIQTAVQCPSGSQYILLTATGHLYQLDLETLAPVLMIPRWDFRHQPQSPDEFVALAKPEDNVIYAFRIENNEMILDVVRGNNMPMRKGFLAPIYPDSVIG